MRKAKRKVIRTDNNNYSPDEKIFPILETHLLWNERECMRTHFWQWITPRRYDCPKCLWREDFVSTWLSGKPVGAS